MQFKYPEFLYFLGFILIPILVHLFQLQRFQKTAFTNVAFLQKLTQQTRKSSRLKKWLILCTRILLFSALIIAFSQPYNSSQKHSLKTHNFIYLDNSLSLNAKGEKGNLLQNTIKEIINSSSEKATYSLLTNSNFYKKISSIELKNILLNTSSEAKSTSFNSVLLKFESEKENQTNTSHKNILISDFQNIKKEDVTNVKSKFHLIQTLPNSKSNLSIDSLFIAVNGDANFILDITINNQGIAKENIPITLYNNNVVFAKQTFNINKDSKKQISFPIQNISKFNGKITLDFSDVYTFDNHYFFTLNSGQKTTVFNIGKKADFLSKIYSKNEFNFSSSSLQNINYNLLQKQELIILNEIDNIPPTLATLLQEHLNQNKSLVIIPSSTINLNSYNSFLRSSTKGQIQQLQKDSTRITNINFKSPFFKNVFSKEIRNFQFPINKNYYSTNFKNTSSLIRFENQQNFLEEIFTKTGKLYWFSSAINSTNSNFTNSPLIVPVFYKFAKLSAQLAKPYYNILQENNIAIPITLEKNEVVSISNTQESFIPLQQSFSSKTTLTTKEKPTQNGFYNITNKDKTIATIAFNYTKDESSLNFLDVKELAKNNENINYSDSISKFFKENSEKNKVTWLWKWFLALAIVSLLFEILILKFFKP